MRIPGAPGAHLTYCLNVHAGESWSDNLAAIQTSTRDIRQQVQPDAPFGLGLRLSSMAADTLSDSQTLSSFREFLAHENLYAFTVNGFPYGTFHNTAVKEQVYQPDWRTPERLAYTTCLVDILAALLPEDIDGSISTVPGSYGSWIQKDADRFAILDNLLQAAHHCHKTYERTGKMIRLALEPEPDCWIENTAGFIEAFQALLERPQAKESIVRQHIGMCFDTCHLLLQFENLEDSLGMLHDAGSRIPKLQISAALKMNATAETARQLSAFDDAVYLHQVRIRDSQGIRSFPDLGPALKSADSDTQGEWRVHCHIPLYHEHYQDIGSTADSLTPAFFGKALEYGIDHFEMETYTFTVLPEDMRAMGIVESIVKEYAWVLAHMPGRAGEKS